MSLTNAQKAAMKDALAANGPIRLERVVDGRCLHSPLTVHSLLRRRMLDRVSGLEYVVSEYGLRVCISEGIGE